MSPTLDQSAPPLQTVHPHQIGVQEFAAYSLVIDARSRKAFGVDHIPGAVSLPIGTRRGLDRLRGLVGHLSTDATVLLYANSSEQPLDAWAVWLRTEGFAADVLPGGWLSYRRWVSAGLELMPRLFEFRALAAPLASGVELVALALSQLGEQVIDLGEQVDVARWPGIATRRRRLSQDAFDTWLLSVLRHRETDRRVWLVEPLAANSTLRLPAAFREAMQRAPRTALRIPAAERAREWSARLSRATVTLSTALQSAAHACGLATNDLMPRLASAPADAVMAEALQRCDKAPIHEAALSHPANTLDVQTLAGDTLRADLERFLVQSNP